MREQVAIATKQLRELVLDRAELLERRVGREAVAPVGATPSAFIPITFPVFGLYISACVSPPQLRVSHIVEVAAIIAHAASTALPPFMNMRAPAVAAIGLPVTATQCRP